MRLDATDLRYLSSEEFRVLKAAETGSLSHEVVPSSLIATASGLHHGGLNKIMSELARRGLIARERNIKYDGWRLTYGGYDWLAIRAMREKGALLGVGTRVGVGKESDIYMAHQPAPATDEDDEEELPPLPAVLKVHRLGRISFRKIKEKRDYLGTRKSAPNWMYLSRLAAKKEWQFMQTLHQHGFPVPQPIYQSRHAILMSRINGHPLRQIVDLPVEYVASLFASLMALIVRLARAGLIHCDFNEFNIMIREAGREGQQDDEDEDEERIWSRAKATLPAQEDDEQEYVPMPGERVEKGNGFERIYREPALATEQSDDEIDEDSDEDSDEYEQQEFDEDGTNEGLRVQLKDGSSIEPILIDFPQMISVEHPNAQYYFDRDVDGVRSFFRRRFRFESDNVPNFHEIVPAGRQKEREIRASRRARRAKEAKLEGRIWHEEDAAEEERPLGLELDVLTQASGLGSNDKDVTALEQYMTVMRVRTESGQQENDEESGDDEEIDADNDGNADDDASDVVSKDVEQDLDPRLQDAILLPPSTVEPIGRGFARQSRRRREGGGAAMRKQRNGEDYTNVEDRVAAERQRKAHQNAKHHGKKAQAGKAGRSWSAGGNKAKTGDKALLDNSLQF